MLSGFFKKLDKNLKDCAADESCPSSEALCDWNLLAEWAQDSDGVVSCSEFAHIDDGATFIDTQFSHGWLIGLVVPHKQAFFQRC